MEWAQAGERVCSDERARHVPYSMDRYNNEAWCCPANVTLGFAALLAFAGGPLATPALGQVAAFAQTQPATLVTSTSATLNGMAVPNGTPSVAWFEWGPLGSYGQQTSVMAIGTGTAVVPVNESITGLTNQGIYQFRLVVSNGVGLTIGFVQLFTTGRRLVGWGANGQLYAFTSAPSNAVAYSPGDQSSLALTSDNGTVLSWSSEGWRKLY